MRFRFLEFLIFLLHNSLVLNLEFFLFDGILRLFFSHLRHVEDLKHGKKVEMLHIQAFKDDLSYDKVNVFRL